MATLFWNIIFGPRLHSVHGIIYQPNRLESTGNTLFASLAGARHLCIWLSPLLICTGYRRGWYQPTTLISFAQAIVIVYAGAYILRTFGRLSNDVYRQFARQLAAVIDDRTNNVQMRRELAIYDYEQWAAPIDFTPSTKRNFDQLQFIVPIDDVPSSGNYLFDAFERAIAYLAVQSFGRRMLFPGSVALLRTMMSQTLIGARRDLLMRRPDAARRAIIATAYGDRIDSVFIDRRNTSYAAGNTLVVTFEGNAGHYESGTMTTPRERGYSVLGWNHPGFGESTGQPHPPRRDLAAIDAVMQYAINRLGFVESDIVLFAWSIGGFGASWTAMNYRHVRAIILDATFDDLVELAKSKMPTSCSRIVHRAIREHLDMPISQHLAAYMGPVLIIRRTHDEIIITADPTASADRQLASNCANILLHRLLIARYPNVMTDPLGVNVLQEWLAMSNETKSNIHIDDEQCRQWLIDAYLDGEAPNPFPLNIQEPLDERQRTMLIRFLARHYLHDFDSTHNTALPGDHFSIPIHPWIVDQ